MTNGCYQGCNMLISMIENNFIPVYCIVEKKAPMVDHVNNSKSLILRLKISIHNLLSFKAISAYRRKHIDRRKRLKLDSAFNFWNNRDSHSLDK